MSELDGLYRLQAIDTELFGLKEEEKSLPLRQELEEKESGLAALEEESVELRQGLKEVRDRQRRQEQKIEDLSAKISGEEDKLYGGRISNPKELRSIQAEVQSIKRKRDQEETALLEEMEKAEELEESIRDRGERSSGLEESLLACRVELARESDRIARARGEAEGKRAELTPAIPAASLKVYDELITSRHRLAVVKVVDGACLGCHMSMPAQEYDRFLKSEDLFRCSNCRRILVK